MEWLHFKELAFVPQILPRSGTKALTIYFEEWSERIEG